MRKLLTIAASCALLYSTAQTKKDSTLISIGYGKSSQMMLTGAIDQLSEGKLKKGLVLNSLDVLNGQAAGVQVQTGVNQEAALSAVRVRGTTSLTGGNDPLVIIDGVHCDILALSGIYPLDIESFTILKDASETAQYGSRGAAGVIVVRTKGGKEGKFHIAYNTNVGFEHAYKSLDMLDANGFRQAAEKMGLSYIDKGYNTDFTQVPIRTGFVHNHHIAFGAGTEMANYRASIGIMNHETVVRNNSTRNYFAKLDLVQYGFDKHLKVNLGMFGSLLKSENIAKGQELAYSSATFNPTFPEGRNAAGGYDKVTEASWISNPSALLNIKDDDNNAHLNFHLKATIDLGHGLTLTGFGSFSYNNIQGGHYYPTYVVSKGEAMRQDIKSEELMGNVSLGWKKKYGPHFIELFGLAEAKSHKTKEFHTTVTGFSSDAFGYNNLSAGATRPWEGTGSSYIDDHTESFLIRAQYSYLNRYTLSLNMRADGSSKVGRNNRWGYFPSISAAWIVSDEPFLRHQRWLNKLKLRMGYGRSGSLGGIGSYMSHELYQPNGIGIIGGAPGTTLGLIRNANPDLRWEIKRTFNVGVDMAFWNNRIALTADFYTSHTSDMLYKYQVPVPPFAYNQLLANLGKMRNHGFEIGFGITVLDTRDVDLSINTNWTFVSNELVTLNGDYNGQYLTAPSVKGISSLYGAGYHGGSDVCFQIVGEPLGVFYLPHCTGLTTAPDGTRRYEVTKEKYICGQATPKVLTGSNIAFGYKQWDISIQMNGAFGHKIFNGTALTYMNIGSLPNYNVMADAPAMNIKDQTISDYWLEDGDYLNIDYITIGWDVPIRSKYIQHLRLSCSVNNVATITGYSGMTPMINSSVVNNTLGLDDKRNYPVYRSYSLGLNIQF